MTQATTDPRLGYTALRLLEMGFSAPKVIDDLVRSDHFNAYRQLGIVDRDGNAAAFTGGENRPWCGHLTADNIVVAGNFLKGQRTVESMFEAFHRMDTADLEERLLTAVEAGRDAGGQHEGQHSAGLLVYDDMEYPWVDLRVDEHDEPIAELRRIFERYEPLREYFAVRAARPDIGTEAEWLRRAEEG